MDAYVITIARQYGSGGRSIGEDLAKKLGISYYDKNIIRMASDESGILEELFGSVDEYSDVKAPLFEKKGIYTGELLPPENKNFTSGVNLFSYQAKVIKELAQRESCVIIGRCANLVLDPEHYPNVLRVYIHANWETRMQEASKKRGGSRKDIARFMRRDDKRKEELCRRYTGKDWRDPAYYDLYLDTGEMSREEVEAAIEKAYNEMKAAK